jgi:hypothetical protein
LKNFCILTFSKSALICAVFAVEEKHVFDHNFPTIQAPAGIFGVEVVKVKPNVLAKKKVQKSAQYLRSVKNKFSNVNCEEHVMKFFDHLAAKVFPSSIPFVRYHQTSGGLKGSQDFAICAHSAARKKPSFAGFLLISFQRIKLQPAYLAWK